MKQHETRNNMKHNMKRHQIPQKLVHEKFYGNEKFYVHQIAAVNL